MHKEGNELRIIYPRSRSALITFTVRVTKQHLVNMSFLKKTSASHYRGTIGLAVLEIKHIYFLNNVQQYEYGIQCTTIGEQRAFSLEFWPIPTIGSEIRYSCV